VRFGKICHKDVFNDAQACWAASLACVVGVGVCVLLTHESTPPQRSFRTLCWHTWKLGFLAYCILQVPKPICVAVQGQYASIA
jgi:hypothetical protein